MKLRRSVMLSTAALLMVVVVAGCARRVPPPAPPPPAPPPPAATPAPPPPPPPPPKPAPAPPPKPLTEDEIFQKKTLAELNAEMPLGDVFFDYDMSTIREDARPIFRRTRTICGVGRRHASRSRDTRLAWHHRVQLGAWCASSRCGARLPRESRDRARSPSGHQQR